MKARAIPILAMLVTFLCATRAVGAVVPIHIAYGSSAGQHMDLYPAIGKPGPLLLFLHGGAWVTGDAAQYARLGQAFAARGIATAVVDYDLAPSVRADRMAEEVADALGWLVAHPTTVDFDTSRIFLMGHSAGAQLVMMVSARGSGLLARAHLPALGGTIALDGVGYAPSFRDADFGSERDQLYTEVFGPSNGWGSYDLSRYITGKEAPVLVVRSTSDELTALSDSQNLAQMLAAHGVRTAFLQPSGLEHFEVVTSMFSGDTPLFAAIVHFVTTGILPTSGG